jgi:hypothetical protein
VLGGEVPAPEVLEVLDRGVHYKIIHNIFPR